MGEVGIYTHFICDLCQSAFQEEAVEVKELTRPNGERFYTGELSKKVRQSPSVNFYILRKGYIARATEFAHLCDDCYGKIYNTVAHVITQIKEKVNKEAK